MNPRIEFIEMDELEPNTRHVYEEIQGERSNEVKQIKMSKTWLNSIALKIILIAVVFIILMAFGWFCVNYFKQSDETFEGKLNSSVSIVESSYRKFENLKREDKSIKGHSTCGNWIDYKDEKCFKILDDSFRTFDEAVISCHDLDIDSTLPIIQTRDEQGFLSNYLFNVQGKVYNFWLGAKYVSDKFEWIDNSVMSFTNWDSRGPRSKQNNCAQIQADESFVGKWIGDPCVKKNLVVCQKLQSWSTTLLQKTLLNARREFRDSLDTANKKIVQLKTNQVPIGFIYGQQPNEKSPAEIWPTMNWSDVSITYAGVFFRVNGGDAAPFGQVQEDNAPRLEEVYTHDSSRTKSGINKYYNLPDALSIPKYGWSDSILTGDYDAESAIYTQFKHSSGEVRPRNMAIRIWKRTM